MDFGSLHGVLTDVGRLQKPRDYGLTIALDVGLGPSQASDLVEVCGAHLDYVKIAWGSSLISGALGRKVEIYRAAGVEPLLGGTLFEYAYLYGRAERLLDFVRETGFHIELSDGTLDIPHEDMLKWLERFAAHATVFSEIGGKTDVHIKDWGKVIREHFAAGASKIVVEGRQVGPVGQPIREDFVDEVTTLAGGHERLIWEALERKQQLYFLKKHGLNVNLANIKTDDVLTLESFRRGLKEHTLRDTWARHQASRKKGS